jgi:hypothetical protein
MFVDFAAMLIVGARFWKAGPTLVVHQFELRRRPLVVHQFDYAEGVR